MRECRSSSQFNQNGITDIKKKNTQGKETKIINKIQCIRFYIFPRYLFLFIVFIIDNIFFDFDDRFFTKETIFTVHQVASDTWSVEKEIEK